MATGNLYQLLGLPPQATPEDIQTAYHQVARRFHPDVNAGPLAEEEFKRVAEAYTVLSDPAQRAAYDTHLAQAPAALFTTEALYSRPSLRPLTEPQVLYTLVTLQAPRAAAPVTAAPVNLCLVIDRSTSMQGERLECIKVAIQQVIDELRPADTCSVVTFSDRAEVVIAALAGTADRAVARAKVSTIHASGGTEILEGLLSGLTLMRTHLSPTAVNHLILLTDGRTYGDEGECLLLAMLAATDGIVLSGLGLGEEWNDQFLDELTACTGGATAYIREPQQVAEFIREWTRGLSHTYAERLELRVVLDAGVTLGAAYKVSPESSPVTIQEMPIRLGSLAHAQALTVLFKFILPPLADPAAGRQAVARLNFKADVAGLNRRGDLTPIDLDRPVASTASTDTLTEPPPDKLVQALHRLSQYQLQERAQQEAAAGDINRATWRLSTLSTRLLASGQPQLAQVALAEAQRLEHQQALSETAKKHLKYGTRALLLAPPVSTSNL